MLNNTANDDDTRVFLVFHSTLFFPFSTLYSMLFGFCVFSCSRAPVLCRPCQLVFCVWTRVFCMCGVSLPFAGVDFGHGCGSLCWGKMTFKCYAQIITASASGTRERDDDDGEMKEVAALAASAPDAYCRLCVRTSAVASSRMHGGIWEKPDWIPAPIITTSDSFAVIGRFPIFGEFQSTPLRRAASCWFCF